MGQGKFTKLQEQTNPTFFAIKDDKDTEVVCQQIFLDRQV
jgi:hypothetical protein